MTVPPDPPAPPEPPRQPSGYGAPDPKAPAPEGPRILGSGSLPGESMGGGRPGRHLETLALVGVMLLCLIATLVGVGLAGSGKAGVAVLYALVALPLLVYCVRTTVEARRRRQHGGDVVPEVDRSWADSLASFTLWMLAALGVLLSTMMALGVLLFIVCMVGTR